jgi:uncharacterized protein YneR
MLKILTKYKYPLMLTLGLSVLSGFISQEQQSSLYWYYNGQELRWSAQPDVFVFRMKDHKAFIGPVDEAIVEATEFRNDDPDKLNIFFFRNGTSQSEINGIIAQVKETAGFEAEFPAITMLPAAAYTENMWYFANDRLIVQFRSDSLARAHVTAFKQRYSLVQTNDVSNLPAGGIYAYIFQFTPGTGYQNVLELTQTIYQQDSSFVLSAEPNLVKIYRQPVSGVTSTADEQNATFEEEFYVVNDREQTLQAYFKLKPQQLNFSAYDIFGRQVYIQKVPAGEKHIDLDISTFSPGIYFACMEDANGQPLYVRKFRKF